MKKMRKSNRNRLIISIITVITAFTIALTVNIKNGEIPKFIDSSFKLQSDSTKNDEDYVQFIDVGQGDCILIQSNGKSALIDTGTVNFEDKLCSILNSKGIDAIDVVIVSHLHTDHTGSLPKICDNYRVDNLILPEISVRSEGLSAAQYAINVLSERKSEIYTAEQGMNFTLGDFKITVLASYGDLDDENNRSLFVMAEIEGKRFMFSGDAEKTAENMLLKEGLNLDCDVFKAGHHGSNTSNSEKFLKAMTPEYIVVSCGKDNMYGHPNVEVLSLCEKMGIDIFRTDKQGDITFYISNGKITYNS